MKIFFILSLAFVGVLSCGESPNVEHWERKFEADKNGIGEKILGGTFSAKVSWPWLVHVEDPGYFCTGSIIHPNWVITAKHCVSDTLVVGFGDSDTRKQQRINVNETYVLNPECHESFECFKGKDIALLYLEEPIPESKYSSSICLKRNISKKWGDLEAAAGWGTYLIPDSDTASGYSLERSPHCREVGIPIRAIEQGYCDTVTADDKHEICAGTWNHGTTVGDSGGPIMALIDGKWYQHGITSRGSYLKNDDPQMFRDEGIYTDITSYCDWIAEITKGDVKCQ